MVGLGVCMNVYVCVCVSPKMFCSLTNLGDIFYSSRRHLVKKLYQDFQNFF